MWVPDVGPPQAASASYNRGCIAIVTGASRGLGREITLEFLRRRVSVIGVARTAADLNSLLGRALSEAQGNARLFPCVADITTEEGMWAIEATLAHSDQVLIALINNAGGVELLDRSGDKVVATFKNREDRAMASIENASMDAWRAIFDVNVFAAVNLIRRFLPIMRLTKGRIINISLAEHNEDYNISSSIGSRASTQSYHGWAAYCVSKGAINMLTKSLAHEEPDIVSIAICPGFMDTDMYNYVMKKGSRVMDKKEYKRLQQLQNDKLPDDNNRYKEEEEPAMNAQKKIHHPSEPAYVIVRLALESSSKLSGGLFTWDAPELDYFHDQGSFAFATELALRGGGGGGEETILPPENLFGSY
ncbi:hypothetical protein H4R24_003429 [Coemansia sp. RSA 988]|nr:hypothetical protein H4R24_003429 [Coemansia sp. RSA 988]